VAGRRFCDRMLIVAVGEIGALLEQQVETAGDNCLP